jgi:PadR family transcriptional regulator, regulatory protein PadR
MTREAHERTLLDALGKVVYYSLLGGLGMKKPVELVQGTLDMLILKAVSLGGLHGYGVLLRLQQLTGGELQIQQGSLYPALYRLEHQGLIASEWGESENKRKAKFYSLTAAGRKRLKAETESWSRFSALVAGVLSAVPEGS